MALKMIPVMKLFCILPSQKHLYVDWQYTELMTDITTIKPSCLINKKAGEHRQTQ